MKKFSVLTITLIPLALFALVSCSKEEEKVQPKVQAKSGTGALPTTAQQEVSLADEMPLLTALPPATNGFLFWNTSSEAYKKYLASPWGQHRMRQIDPKTYGEVFARYSKAFETAGLDLNNYQAWEKFFANGVVFVATNPTTGPSLGLYFESAPGSNLTQSMNTLSTELAKAGAKLSPPQYKGISGFGLDPKQFDAPAPAGQTEPAAAANPATNKVIQVAWKDNRGVIALDGWLVEELFAKGYKELPKVTTSSAYTELAKRFPHASERFAMGYLDINGMLGQFGAMLPEEGKQAMAKNPVEAIAGVGAMTSSPESRLFAKYSPKDEEQKKYFDIVGKTAADDIISVLPKGALFTLSLDGQALKRAKDTFIGPMAQDPAVQPFIGAIDSLTRLGVSAKMAAPGQSLLPIPAVSIVASSSKPQEVEGVAKMVAEMAGVQFGVPGGGWTDTNVAGVAAKSMLVPGGVNLHLASTGSFVFLTSTREGLENQLAVVQKKGAGLAEGFTPEVKTLLGSEPSLANIYVDFAELSDFMKNMAGTLTMYAPQNDQAKQLFDEKSLDELKRLGVMASAIQSEPGLITMRNFYAQPIAVQPKS
ncbi:hypothetical protein JNK13_07475 [bacterium]|nr:hypothetical protein [bacterium]